ncbi:MAG: preprotein translocase subunit YajC [Micromonosporaceae bacterium]
MVVAQQGGGGGGLLPILMIGLIIVAMYFFIIRPQQRQRKAAQEMQSKLAVGNQVVTIGGLYGTVVQADDETITLEVAPGVTNKYVRGAVSKVVEQKSDEPESDGGDTKGDESTS